MAGEGKSKKGILKIIVGGIVTILILLIIAVALIKFDVGGLGTKIIGPKIIHLKGSELILPEMPEEEGSEGYHFETVEEAIEILKITEKMLKETADKAEILDEQLELSKAEVKRLKIFEANQVAFEKDKAEFDTWVVEQAKPVDYKEWFEKINPESAAIFYQDVIKDVAYSKELKGTIDIYQSMKPAQAAIILEGMSTTKLDQVATIIKALKADQAAEILGKMDPVVAAKITTYIYPEEG